MPLRTRMLVVIVVLLAIGLGLAGFVTYRILSASLIDRVDDQLKAAVRPAADRLSAPTQTHPGEHGLFLPEGSYAALLDQSGRVRREARFAFGQPAPRPRIPSNLVRPQAGKETLRTVPAVTGSTDYRLVAKPVEQDSMVIVALPLGEVRATLRRLLVIGASVGGSVLLAIGLAAYWLTRRELRPLERMTQKARAIAAGDLSQRVAPNNPRTEVGRLGAALNTMLSEIERAFDERRAAEERLRQFVADASHELRTPVTAIRGFAELFRRGAADRPADLAKVMRRIEDEGERMGELVEELLLLARLDQGLPLEHEPVDLATVVEAAVDAARAADPERPIKVESHRPLFALGDRARLRQVVDNLLTNARLHTPAGTAICVRLTAEDVRILLEVADEGPGVAADEVERIFERFYRTDRSRTRSKGGIGLGLAIVRSLVDAHGGEVEYRARPGGGSIFRVVLPASQADARAASQPATPSVEQPFN